MKSEPSAGKDSAGARGLTIALAGNPNSGKTTIFNNLTGAHQHVGNWPGVTVEKKSGRFSEGGFDVTVVDLPGTYSLTAYSLEEVIAREFIVNESPDAVVNVVDASNLERNLYFTAQLLELGVPVVVCLNMIDVARGRKLSIDTKQLGQLLGAPVVECVGRENRGTTELKDAIISVAEGRAPYLKRVRINYGSEVEKILDRIEAALPIGCYLYGQTGSGESSDAGVRKGKIPARWLAVKLLEKDEHVVKMLDGWDVDRPAIEKLVEESRAYIESVFSEEAEIVITDSLFSFARGATAEVLDASKEERITWSDRIDAVLTNRLLGLPIFALFMYFVFAWTFDWSGPLSDIIDAFFGWLSGAVFGFLGGGLLADLIANGIIAGVGGVLVFLPPILLLFLFFSFLEDSGYMARAAFLMDRLMHVVGLHGKSFIVLLVSFGCNVPAVMAARTLENPRDRLITILVAPLMSCAARLPVYVLFAGAFFPEHAGLVIFIMYFSGTVIALVMALLFRKTLFRGESAPFVMELPPYRVPTVRSVLIHMWDRGSIFLKKAGTIILAGVVIVWFLQAFPRNVPLSRDYETEINAAAVTAEAELAAVETAFGREELRIRESQPEEAFVPAEETGAYREAVAYRDKRTGLISAERDAKIAALKNGRRLEEAEYRFAGRFGKVVEPVLRPIGLDWRAGVALVPGFIAKEIVVGSLGVMYAVGEEEGEESEGLRSALRASFTPLTAIVFMLFTLLYIPCLATVGVIRRESGSWKWTLFAIGYSVVLAYIVCLAVFQVGRIFFA